MRWSLFENYGTLPDKLFGRDDALAAAKGAVGQRACFPGLEAQHQPPGPRA